MLRECIDTSGDIPVNINDTLDEFAQKFPKFDTSAFDKYSNRANYYLEDIEDDWAKEILAKLEPKEDDP